METTSVCEYIHSLLSVKGFPRTRMENQFESNNILMERYEVGRLLGRGSFAKVHHARDLKSGQCVAIKVIDKKKALKAKQADRIKREISVMRRVKHPNVLRIYEVMASKTKIYLVIEYAEGGELFDKIAQGRLTEDAGREYFRQLIDAVRFCHGNGVYHRDLKPENLLLDGNGVLKVSDFGLSALAEEHKSRDGLLSTTCGSPSYVAPEILCTQSYDGAKADVWSCGVILFVMLAGYLPFHHKNIFVMYKKASGGDYQSPPWFAPEVCQLLSRMLDPNPKTRITIAEIMEYPWFIEGSDSQSVALGLQQRSNPNNMQTSSTTCTSTTTRLDSLTCESIEEEAKDLEKPMSVNAFDIISHSAGVNLSGLFVEKDRNKEVVEKLREDLKDIVWAYME
ncbi:CBL-interacting protein kinase 5 [Linum grandiflorum]